MSSLYKPGTARGLLITALTLNIFPVSFTAYSQSDARSYNTLEAETRTAGLPLDDAPHSRLTLPLSHIQDPWKSPRSQFTTIPYGKSTVIDLPVELRDIIIANPGIVESILHNQRRVLLIGRRPGQTNGYFYGENGQEILNLEIRVERDMNELESLIAQNIPSANISIHPVNNNILLTGTVTSASLSQKVADLATLWLDEATESDSQGRIVNLLSIEGKDQVLLKVRIVEMQRSVTKQLGINLNAIGQLGESTISLFSNNAVGVPAAVLGDTAGLTASGQYNNAGTVQQLGATLTALERVGLIRTKAEPTLTATSGETANFLVGGEFPVLTNIFIDNLGRPQRSFDFRAYGVSLGFTPVVLNDGRISLNISTEVSEPTTEGAFETGGLGTDILGLRIRRANTVVELPAGGSLVIAGLVREENRQAISGVPGAKDIPIVGAAFRNRDDLTTQSELVIIVTPYLAEATHQDKLHTPLDKFTVADDSAAVLLGRLNEVYKPRGIKLEKQHLSGPFGYVVD